MRLLRKSKAASVGGLFQSPPRRTAVIDLLHALAGVIPQPKNGPGLGASRGR
jgi:hypothetical protein